MSFLLIYLCPLVACRICGRYIRKIKTSFLSFLTYASRKNLEITRVCDCPPLGLVYGQFCRIRLRKHVPTRTGTLWHPCAPFSTLERPWPLGGCLQLCRRVSGQHYVVPKPIFFGRHGPTGIPKGYYVITSPTYRRCWPACTLTGPQWPSTGLPMGVLSSHTGNLPKVPITWTKIPSIHCMCNYRATMALYRPTNGRIAVPHRKFTEGSNNVDQIIRSMLYGPTSGHTPGNVIRVIPPSACSHRISGYLQPEINYCSKTPPHRTQTACWPPNFYI